MDITPFRRLGNRFSLAVFNSLYNAELTDLCYGFCAFHHRYLEHLNLTADGFEIAAMHVLERYSDNIRGVGSKSDRTIHRHAGLQRVGDDSPGRKSRARR